MKQVINLTKFKATADLERFGVKDLRSWKEFQEIRNLLYFPLPPTQEQVSVRVERLAEIARNESEKTGATSVLVSCPPWMMRSLCAELIYFNLKPVVSFTKKTTDEGMSIIALVEAA